MALGRRALAESYLKRCIDAVARGGEAYLGVSAELGLAQLAREGGRLDDARRHLRDALQVAVRIEDLPLQIECLVQHAEWLDAHGDGPRAAAILALLLGRPEISANVRRDVEHWLHAHGWAVHGSAPAPELSFEALLHEVLDAAPPSDAQRASQQAIANQ
jgi:ATP/maltotriose-dependent transcriptional regulator MalT